VAALVLCWRLSDSDITVMPSVTLLAMQSCSWCCSPFTSIGFCYENEWEM